MRLLVEMKQHRIPFPPHPDDLRFVIETFKALADDTRAQIILLLGKGEKNVGELVNRLNAPQSTVSRHLSVLRAAGLVATRREGTSIYYQLTGAHVANLVEQAFSHAEHERLGMPDPVADLEKATSLPSSVKQ